MYVDVYAVDHPDVEAHRPSRIQFDPSRNEATEQAVALIVNGYAKEVLNQLPMEFAVEAQKLLEISLEGSVG